VTRPCPARPRSSRIFEDEVRALPQIIAADNVAGETDYLLTVVARDVADLQEVLASLATRGGQRLVTYLRLAEVKRRPAAADCHGGGRGTGRPGNDVASPPLTRRAAPRPGPESHSCVRPLTTPPTAWRGLTSPGPASWQFPVAESGGRRVNRGPVGGHVDHVQLCFAAAA